MKYAYVSVSFNQLGVQEGPFFLYTQPFSEGNIKRCAIYIFVLLFTVIQ